MTDRTDTLHADWLTGEAPMPKIVKTLLVPAPAVDPIVHDPTPGAPVVRDYELPDFDASPLDPHGDDAVGAGSHRAVDACGTTGPGAGAGHRAGVDQRAGETVAWRLGYGDGLVAGRAEGERRGFAEGFELGRSEGRDACRVAAAEVVRTLRRRLDESIERLDAVAQELATSSTGMAVEIAAAVLDRELAVSADPGADALRRAVAALPADLADRPAVAYLHPGDLDLLVDGAPAGSAASTPSPTAPESASASIQFVADPAVRSGDCRLSCGPTHVDAAIGSALQRVRATLGLVSIVDDPAVTADDGGDGDTGTVAPRGAVA